MIRRHYTFLSGFPDIAVIVVMTRRHYKSCLRAAWQRDTANSSTWRNEVFERLLKIVLVLNCRPSTKSYQVIVSFLSDGLVQRILFFAVVSWGSLCGRLFWLLTGAELLFSPVKANAYVQVSSDQFVYISVLRKRDLWIDASGIIASRRSFRGSVSYFFCAACHSPIPSAKVSVHQAITSNRGCVAGHLW